jgi:hypothetical protein
MMDMIWSNRDRRIRLPFPLGMVNIALNTVFMLILVLVTIWRMFTSQPTDRDSRIAAAILLVALFSLMLAMLMYRPFVAR